MAGSRRPSLPTSFGDIMNSTREILDSLDIEEVAVALGMRVFKSRRGETKTLCPFHADKDPSLVIYSDRSAGKQHFHCYACGEHGDAIDLVKGVLHVDLKGAMDWLASRFQSVARLRQSGSSKRSNVDGLALALELYRERSDLSALSHWLAKRGIEPAVATRAGLIFASNNTLSNSLSELSSGDVREVADYLSDSFLIRKLLPTTGPSYNLHLEREARYIDYFPGDRIVIPIRDAQGLVIGLAGRAADESAAKDTPKYMLTKGLKKAIHLYNGNIAFAQLRDLAKKDPKSDLPLYVCEGFFDALRLSGSGLPAVAVMGSSLSQEQAKLIRSISNEIGGDRLAVKVLMDDDEAGLRGASQSIKHLLEIGLEAIFSYPYHASSRDPTKKDPDSLFFEMPQDEIRQVLVESDYPPGIGILAAEFAADARMLLDNEKWASSPRSRRILAIERATATLRRIGPDANKALFLWITKPTGLNLNSIEAANQWADYVSSMRQPSSDTPRPFNSNDDAKLNHARLLAYKGSRRGELPCDEPRWQRLDQAATIFNVALKERLALPHVGDMSPADAVWVPRAFGKEEPRLKVMPPCEVLTIQQYLLNEILSEKLDTVSVGSKPFSHFVPAVRYYRESNSTRTTGLSANTLDDELDRPLSYAYQIDMEVIEGRQPASDQGMFRQFSDCWKQFISSINEQSELIGFVHTDRLDVSRYYDRIRRYVARDSLLPKLTQALDSIPSHHDDFCGLLTFGRSLGSTSIASTAFDYLSSSIFGYAYHRPDTGKVESISDNIGIPQGPVISAWLGSITLFPVDQVALDFKQRYNLEGKTRIGYARYVDDIVLLADSAHLLEEFRRQIMLAAGKLDLVLLAKAETIPPMSSSQFSQFINSGRALAASGPAWEPQLIGDGDSGWEPWAALPDTDRQSALQILSDWTLYSTPVSTILQAVKTAFLAPDLRASELAKAARLIWYAVAVSLKSERTSDEISFSAALGLFEGYWEYCCVGASWKLEPENNPWELLLSFALEGLDKLLDSGSYPLPMLTAAENADRRAGLALLADIARGPDFPNVVRDRSRSLHHQMNRRLRLIIWKANQGNEGVEDQERNAERARTLGTWNSIEWMHLAVVELARSRGDDLDPLAPFAVPLDEAKRRAIEQGDVRSFQLMRQLLPELQAQPNEPQEFASIALQTIVSVAPRSKLVAILSKRIHLLGAADDGLLLMPPLPGIDQKRLLACVTLEESADFATVETLEAYEPTEQETDPDPFLLVEKNGEFAHWHAIWAKSRRENLQIRSAAIADWQMRVRRAPAHSKSARPKEVAALYRTIVRASNHYAEQQENQELVPSWSSIATNSDGVVLILNEGAPLEQITNKAFVRNGGRGLRTIEVPIYEARLWRAGVAVSDYFGFIDDIGKYGELDDPPIDGGALANISEYIVRCQLRKLRGEHADSSTGRRLQGADKLPISVERSLKFLEEFPDDVEKSGNDKQIAALLSNEADLAGMRIRYIDARSQLSPTEFLRRVADRVISRLPAEIGEHLNLTRQNGDLRSDIAALLPLARAILRLSPAIDDSEPPYAWRMFQAGIVSSAISVAFSGLVIALRTRGDFPLPDDTQSDQRHPDQRDSLSNENYLTRPQGKSSGTSPSTILKDVYLRISRRIDLDNYRAPQSETLHRLERLCKLMEHADQPEEDGDWPFIHIAPRNAALLNSEALEEAVRLVPELDLQLGFRNIRVVSPSYGYDPQNRRFRDHRDQEWEIQPWMIGQYPQDRKIEEIADNGRILKAWTETIDLRSQRLIAISVAGRRIASLSSPSDTRDSAKNDEQPAHPTNKDAAPQREQAETSEAPCDLSSPELKAKAEKRTVAQANEYGSVRRLVRTGQRDQWEQRKELKNPAHVRVAILQSEQELSYYHPMMEVHPRGWPLGSGLHSFPKAWRSSHQVHTELDEATSARGREVAWKRVEQSVPSWHEHRRRRTLRRAIEACDALGVNILMLPEYSVREDTVEWIRKELAGKQLAVLAGTYKNFEHYPEDSALQAVLTLLWPVPTIPSGSPPNGMAADSNDLRRVLKITRAKKYRSVGLSEHIRPSESELAPLFRVGNLVPLLEDKLNYKLSVGQTNALLTDVNLPLRHFAELVCSEIFALTSPLNFQHIQDDYSVFCKKFGMTASASAVLDDVKKLGGLLAAGGSAAYFERRSVLMVPAATTRTADY